MRSLSPPEVLRRRAFDGTGSFLLVDYPHRNIRFTRTEDGVDIAFWEIGEGKPVIIIQNFSLSHAELEWAAPSIASFYMEMAERYRIIRIDPRGIGLSGDRPVGWDIPVTAHERGLDIEAVREALALERVALMGVSVAGPAAIAYATTHPDRVTELILCQSFADMNASHLVPVFEAQEALSNLEWDTSSTFYNVWESVVDEADLPAVLRMATNSVARAGRGTKIQVGESGSLLGQVAAPTLILSAPAVEGIVTDARRLAAGIPESQLRMVEGTFAPYWSDRTATLEAIDSLLRPEAKITQMTPSGFRTVVFTDIVGSTEYIRKVGDDAGRAAVRDLETKVAALATDHGGRVVKNLGDGSLVSFGSNSSAIAFGLEVQEKCSDGPLKLRVGMAAGEPIQEEGDIHGTVVAHASRIGDLGDAGEVIVSDSVRQLAAGKGFRFEPKGEVTLKGFDEPERVWRVTRS